ncbi:TPA: helix-turn-helix domain-containing protein [Serratia marcescens]
MGFEVDNAETKRIDLSSHENSSFEVTGLVKHYPAGFVIPYHSHKRSHLLYSQQGVMAVEASSGRWIVPPTTAVWLRPGVEHQLVMQSNICVYGILVDEVTAARLPLRDGVLQVSPLLRELIAQLATLAPEGAETKRNTLLRALFLEELSLQPQLALHLPWPGEARMAEICRLLVITPADDRGIEAWADSLSISAKTFQRHFTQQTGITFGQWKQRLRLLSSIPLLLAGNSIIHAAFESGYESHSAYSVAFKKLFGVSPSRFTL